MAKKEKIFFLSHTYCLEGKKWLRHRFSVEVFYSIVEQNINTSDIFFVICNHQHLSLRQKLFKSTQNYLFFTF